MNEQDIHIYFIQMCRRKHINNDVKYIFEQKLINVNHDDSIYISIAATYGNLEMLRLFKMYGGIMNIRDNEPLILAAQYNHIDCAIFLYDINININEYEYNGGFDNLVEIRNNYNYFNWEI